MRVFVSRTIRELEVIRIRSEKKRKLPPFTSRNFNFYYMRDSTARRVLTSFFFLTESDFFKLENG